MKHDRLTNNGYNKFIFIPNHGFIRDTCDCYWLVCKFEQVDIQFKSSATQ